MNRIVVTVVVIIAALYLFFSSIFVINQREQAIVLRFGGISAVKSEPGLYFKADDVSIPDELRGLGVRIEDDVLVTAEGFENLSGALPRTPDDVEAWLADLRS